jgi:hypothetical protein
MLHIFMSSVHLLKYSYQMAMDAFLSYLEYWTLKFILQLFSISCSIFFSLKKNLFFLML